MPPTPHRTVAHSGMSRSPGATHLPSSPMIAPPMSAQRMVPTMVVVHLPARSAPEADHPGDAGADLDVGDLGAWHQDPPTLAVGECDHARLAGQRLGDLLLDVCARAAHLQHELALGLLDADLDLHGRSS